MPPCRVAHPAAQPVRRLLVQPLDAGRSTLQCLTTTGFHQPGPLNVVDCGPRRVAEDESVAQDEPAAEEERLGLRTRGLVQEPGAMSDWTSVLEQVHDAPQMFVLSVTGGGTGAIGRLLRVPGASRTLLEARVPYAAAALADWLGRPPEQACSRRTGLLLAAAAWQRALQLLQREPERQHAVPVGLGCTASLASDRPKRGDHRCWVATHDARHTRCYHLTLTKGARTRAEEEDVVEQLVLAAVAEACGLTGVPQLPLLEGERVVVEQRRAERPLVDLAEGRRPVVWRLPDGSFQNDLQPRPVGLLCGSFDPLHEGHRLLRRAAEQQLGGPVAYELTLFNADKPPLDYLTLDERCRPLDAPAALTRAATFVEKSVVFPGVTFVVGFDTAVRVLEPRFYQDSERQMLAALEQLAARGCRFLVAGRLTDGRFCTLADLPVPARLRQLFVELPESVFRADVSSTELRRRSAKQD